jgi:hypothetical protein
MKGTRSSVAVVSTSTPLRSHHPPRLVGILATTSNPHPPSLPPNPPICVLAAACVTEQSHLLSVSATSCIAPQENWLHAVAAAHAVSHGRGAQVELKARHIATALPGNEWVTNLLRRSRQLPGADRNVTGSYRPPAALHMPQLPLLLVVLASLCGESSSPATAVLGLPVLQSCWASCCSAGLSAQ